MECKTCGNGRALYQDKKNRCNKCNGKPMREINKMNPPKKRGKRGPYKPKVEPVKVIDGDSGETMYFINSRVAAKKLYITKETVAALIKKGNPTTHNNKTITRVTEDEYKLHTEEAS